MCRHFQFALRRGPRLSPIVLQEFALHHNAVLLGSNYSRIYTLTPPVKQGNSGTVHSMAMSSLNDADVAVATQLLAASDVAARASLIATGIVERLSDCACVVHRFVDEEGEAAWCAIGAAGDISIEKASIPAGNRLIAPLISGSASAATYPEATIRREDYSHLHVARSIASIAYVPLRVDDRLTGAIEIISFSSILRPQDMEEIDAIVRLASPAIFAARS